MEEVSVCVTSPPMFNEELFLTWVNGGEMDDGSSPSATATGSRPSPAAPLPGAGRYDVFQFRHAPLTSTFSDDLMRLEIAEQYRMYDVLEHYISQPLLLSTQQMVLVPPPTQHTMIAYYWSLDDTVVREIVYKRLTKSRKDLDDVADATGYPLKRVTRQFDNLRRIYTAAEDAQWLCNLQTFIETNFCLKEELARKYSCILFLLYSKFNLTTKKRMLRVSCDRLERCAALALAFLVADSTLFFQALLDAARADDNSATATAASSSSSGGAGVPSLDHYRGALARDDVCWPAVWRVVGTMETVELDKQLLINLRDARTVLTGDVLDHACQLVQAAAGRGGSGSSSSGSSLADRRMLDLSRIRTVLKALAQIGGHLSQTREYRDIFEDLLTKVVEPLEEAQLSPADIRAFLACCLHVARALPDNARAAAAPDPPARGGDGARGGYIFDPRALTKAEHMRLDWLRFVAFSRMCIENYI